MQTGTTLRNVEEGMRVFDRDKREIGKVEYVQFGDDDPETVEVESVKPSRPPLRDSLMANIAEVFAPADEIPEEVRRKLLQQGFVRLDADGLFQADRYITPEQIDSVSGDGLTLNVTIDQLVKH